MQAFSSLRVVMFVGLFAGASAVGTGCSLAECGQPMPNVKLHVVDQVTAAPVVPTPTFTENGLTQTAFCASDAGSACPEWNLWLENTHMITVAAAGYQSQTVTIEAGSTGGTCSSGLPVEQTVQLVPQ